MQIQGYNAQDIQDSIRHLIKAGTLAEGAVLPSVRELAGQLGLNRNTVAAAYKALVASGVLISRGRLGTQVPVNRLRTLEGFQVQARDVVDVAHGNPKRELLPTLAQINLAHVPTMLYGESIYLPELLELAHSQVFADLPQFITASAAFEFTYGAVDAIERILAAHLVANDLVAVELPGFITSISAIEHQHFKIQSFQVSPQGVDVDSLQHALQCNVQAIVITPRAQNPTGYSLDLEQVQQIRTLLASYPQVVVIVDDHFSLLAQADYQHLIPESTQHWAVLRSVSKYLGPDLRFAFVCCDRITADRLHHKLNSGSTWVSHIIQTMVLQLMSAADFKGRVEYAKAYYQQQNNALLAQLRQHGIPCSSFADGLNIWLSLPYADEIAKVLLTKGWLVRSGKDYKITEKISGIRISPSNMTKQQMQDFTGQLKQIYEVIQVL